LVKELFYSNKEVKQVITYFLSKVKDR
jgi:hypothetical protein